MLTKFLDPKNDVAFKRIFGSEKNKDILIAFLNDMISFKENAPIVDVTFLKPVQDPDIAARKTSIVDILCKDQNDHTYIVEMQVAKEKGFIKRAQYYAAKAYISQMEKGGKYHHLQEVIFLAITDFIMFPEKTHFKSDHVILDRDSYDHDLKDFTFTFLELPKMNKRIEDIKDHIEKWMYFFKHAQMTHEEDVDRIVGDDVSLKRAYAELNRFSWNEAELFTYEQSLKQEMDYEATMDQKYDDGLAKGREEGEAKGLEKGREEGRAKGEQIGLEKGEKIGLEKGREEGRAKEKSEMITKMLAKDKSLEEIADMLDLSIEEIKSLSRK